MVPRLFQENVNEMTNGELAKNIRFFSRLKEDMHADLRIRGNVSLFRQTIMPNLAIVDYNMSLLKIEETRRSQERNRNKKPMRA